MYLNDIIEAADHIAGFILRVRISRFTRISTGNGKP